MGRTAMIGIGVLIAGAAVLIIRHDSGNVGGFSNDDFAAIVSSLALLILIGGGTMASYFRRGGLAAGVKDMLSWLAIGLMLVIGYTLRHDFQRVGERVIATLNPSQAEVLAGGDIAIQRAADGHFHIDARIGGETIRFLVDTGASRTTLSAQDAERSGIDLGRLDYIVPVNTANGRSFMARARLEQMSFGGISINDVSVLVAPQGQLDGSLLGNNVLGQFSGIKIDRDTLILTP